VSNVLLQLVTSPAPFLGFVSPIELMSAALEVASGPIKAWRQISEKSQIMRGRSADQLMRLTKEAKENARANKTRTFWLKIQDATMLGLDWADKASVMAGWLAVYKREIARTGDETTSVSAADDAVLKTQPSGYWWNSSPLFQNQEAGWQTELARIVLQFQSPLNVIWQNITFDIPNAIKTGNIGNAVGMAAGYAIAGAALGLIREGFSSDDDEIDKARKFAYWSLSQGLQSVPLIGSAVETAAKTLIEGERATAFNTEMFPVVDSASSAISAISSGSFERALREFGEAIGYAVGAPVSGIKEITAAIKDPERLLGRRH
jgi:hypothetical protein